MKHMFVMIVGSMLMLNGCASLVNMKLTQIDRNQSALRAAISNAGEPAIMVDFWELANVKGAPTWRTILCAGLDIGTGIIAYKQADDAGWFGGDDNSSKTITKSKQDSHDVSQSGSYTGDITTGDNSPVTVLIGQGQSQQPAQQ